MKYATAFMLGALAAMAAAPSDAIMASPETFDDAGLTGLKIVGTPWKHRVVDSNGYTLLKVPGDGVSKAGGRYEYAVPNARGDLLPSGVDAASDASLVAGLVPGLIGRPDATQQEAELELRVGSPGARADSRRLVAADKIVNALVLRIRFKDHASRTLPADSVYDEIFNGEVNVNGDNTPTGSVKGYYLQQSYGTFTLNSYVTPWVDLPQDEAYYGAGCSSTCDKITRLQGAIKDAITSLDNGGYNFDRALFDGDNNGFTDFFTVIHSGYGAEYGKPDENGQEHTDRIWSHKYYLNPSSETATGVKTKNGLKFNPYNINPGLWDIKGSDPPHIGVIAHEGAHYLGLPDLYDTDGSSSGLGSFGLMANSWGFDGSQYYPGSMSAWSRTQVGWAEPIVLDSTATVMAPFVQSQDKSTEKIYKITHGYPSNEYILIEYRAAVDHDAIFPAQGLLIWHIDESKQGGNKDNQQEGYPGNSGWPNAHYAVALIEADGDYSLQKGRVRGDASDIWTAGICDDFGTGGAGSLLSYSKISCSTDTSGLTGNKIEITSITDTVATFQYTKKSACDCGQTCDDVVATSAPTPTGATKAPTMDPNTDCVSIVGWENYQGNNCQWFAATGDRCEKYGDIKDGWFGLWGTSANEACCVCGGGSTAAEMVVEELCVDSPQGWYDADGPQYTCAYYNPNRCANMGNGYGNEEFSGKTANQACCGCGGGSGTLGRSIAMAPIAGGEVAAKYGADIVAFPGSEDASSSSVGGMVGVGIGGLVVGAVVSGLIVKKKMQQAESLPLA